jgi:hypothetical protein
MSGASLLPIRLNASHKYNNLTHINF